MKRTLVLGVVLCAACGGRTTLDDSVDGAPIGVDGGPIGVDGGPIGIDGGPIGIDGGPIGIDGGPVDVDAAPPPFDAGPPGNPIQCGNTTCNSSTDVCCVTANGQVVNEACTPIGQCKGAAFSCSSASSCPNNEVCCATFTQTQQTSQCQSACQGGFQNPQLCASTAECPNGLTCKQTPFGFKTCRP
jgi:hypothetical protein